MPLQAERAYWNLEEGRIPELGDMFELGAAVNLEGVEHMVKQVLSYERRHAVPRVVDLLAKDFGGRGRGDRSGGGVEGGGSDMTGR